MKADSPNLVDIALRAIGIADDTTAIVVDCCLMKVAADRQKALAVRNEFLAELAKPRYKLLREGCSYIHATGPLGCEQEQALIASQ